MDAINAGCEDAESYADAVVTYLAFALDKGADYWSSFVLGITWWWLYGTYFRPRQAIAMVWDYAEVTLLCNWKLVCLCGLGLVIS